MKKVLLLAFLGTLLSGGAVHCMDRYFDRVEGRAAEDPHAREKVLARAVFIYLSNTAAAGKAADLGEVERQSEVIGVNGLKISAKGILVRQQNNWHFWESMSVGDMARKAGELTMDYAIKPMCLVLLMVLAIKYGKWSGARAQLVPSPK